MRPNQIREFARWIVSEFKFLNKKDMNKPYIVGCRDELYLAMANLFNCLYGVDRQQFADVLIQELPRVGFSGVTRDIIKECIENGENIDIG